MQERDFAEYSPPLPFESHFNKSDFSALLAWKAESGSTGACSRITESTVRTY
jgi:hypothetical protein